jgi:hypothetical protein
VPESSLAPKSEVSALHVHDRFIPRPSAYIHTVKFAGVPETSELSQAEVALIDGIYTCHRDKTEWELTDFTHTLPE